MDENIQFETDKESSIGKLTDKQVRFIENNQSSEVWKNVLIDLGDQSNTKERWSGVSNQIEFKNISFHKEVHTRKLPQNIQKNLVRFQRQKQDQIKLQKNNNQIANIVQSKKRNTNNNGTNEDQYPVLVSPITAEDQNKIQFLTEKIRLHTRKLNEMKKRQNDMLESAGMSVSRFRSQLDVPQQYRNQSCNQSMVNSRHNARTSMEHIDRSKTPLTLKAQIRFDNSCQVSLRSDAEIKIPWATRLAPLADYDYVARNHLTFNDLNHVTKLKNLESLRRSQITHNQVSNQFNSTSHGGFKMSSIRKSSQPSLPSQREHTKSPKKVPKKVIQYLTSQKVPEPVSASAIQQVKPKSKFDQLMQNHFQQSQELAKMNLEIESVKNRQQNGILMSRNRNIKQSQTGEKKKPTVMFHVESD